MARKRQRVKSSSVVKEANEVPTKMVKPEAEQPEDDTSIIAHRYNLNKQQVFAVRAMAFCEQSKQLCVLRGLQQDSPSDSKNILNNFTFIEFYDATAPPLVFSGRSIPVNEPLNSCVWIGNWAIVGGLNGKLYTFSPFTTRFKSIQICPSEINAMAPLDEHSFVITNKSGDLIQCTKKEDNEELLDEQHEQHKNTNPTFSTRKLVKFPVDKHLTTVACSSMIGRIAVGMINGISLVKLHDNSSSCGKVDKQEIVVPHMKTNAVTIWSLVFQGEFLFAGDSLGQVTIYNAQNGLILKTFKSHRKTVLALATNGLNVFASGTDCRIQIFGPIGKKENSDWQQVGQRLFHKEAVNVMCCLDKEMLVSGATDGIYVSSKHTHCQPRLKSDCSYSASKNILLILHLTHVDVWLLQAPKSDESDFDPFIFQKCKLTPKLALRIGNENIGFIKHTSLSPNGNFLAIAGTLKGHISVLRVSDTPTDASSNLVQPCWDNTQQEAQTGDRGGKAVAAMFATDKCLYYACGEYTIFRLKFEGSQLQKIAQETNQRHLTKLRTNPSESTLVALTTGPIILVFHLTTTSSNASDELVKPTEITLFQQIPYELQFFSEHQILFLMPNLDCHFTFYNISNEQSNCIKAAELKLAGMEWLSYLNFAQEHNKLLATTNKGRVLIFDITEKGKLEMFEASREYAENGANKFEIRTQPFWNIQRAERMLAKSLFLIGTS